MSRLWRTAYITGPGGLPLEQITQSGAVRYYSHDQLGSTTAVTDQSGNTVASYDYDPYGNLKSTPPSIDNPFGYAGQYTDLETGLQYLRARYYDGATGQFLGADPAAGITSQPYAYANDSPTNASDPTGKIAVPLVDEIGAGGADAACGLTWEVPGLDVVTCGAAVVTTAAAGAVAVHDLVTSSQASVALSNGPNLNCPVPGPAVAGGVVFAKQQPASLSPEEQQALANQKAGLPFDQKAYNSARQKQKFNEKISGARNKQKRRSN